jgi:hypothetical protein
MKVDRIRFVELVTLLAGATACAPEPPKAVSGMDVAPLPAQTVELPRPEANGPNASTPPTATATVRPDVPGPQAPQPAGQPAQTGPDGRTPLATSEGSGPLAIDSYDPAARHTCGELRCPPGHPFAEGMKVLQHDCRALERNLQPAAFQRFIQCMLRQNNTRATCDLLLISTDPGSCFEGWTKIKASEPELRKTCAPIVARCAAKPTPPIVPNRSVFGAPGRSTPAAAKPKLGSDDCEGLLAAAKDRAKPKMIACMTEYCEEAPTLCYLSMAE